jgi:REP element-mobilizing transposase RayT
MTIDSIGVHLELPPRRNRARAHALNQVFEAQTQIVIANEECLSYIGIMRRQGRFEFRTWGGKRRGAARRGAGRKRVAERRQGNHLHLLVEAASNQALSRAMKGFLVSCAKRLNKVAGRTGCVFADRFHTRTLATPTAVRNVLRYTLCNGRKHGELTARVRLDPYSSAFALTDWQTATSIRFADVTMQVALPKTYLLREGWRRAGPMSPWDTPSA